MRLLLTVLSALVAGCWAERPAATRCTARACFTLHVRRVSFKEATESCVSSGGHLLTTRDEEEEEDARALFALADEAGVLASGQERLWLGLKLYKGSCVLHGERLRGFRWVSSVADSSALARWSREPQSTCTEERCVSVRPAAAARLDWSDGSCKEAELYACRFQFKGMCEPLALAGPGEVTYNVPFSPEPLNENDTVRMLPYATLAEISCTSSGESHGTLCKEAAAGGSFSWTFSGPFCASGERSCARQNGGCNHVCTEDVAGGVRCACRKGYHLSQDSFTCLERDACQGAPCEHKCVTVGPVFECACREGFRLAQDRFVCVDMDECELDVCGGHVCHNRPGSYECECREGFEKDAGGACEDIDECGRGACGKRARCLNSQGSFSCYCGTGFRPAEGGVGCVDVDECLGRPCEQFCTNTEGSYACSCRENFRLAENSISCVHVVEPGPPTTAPRNPVQNGPSRTTTVTPTTTSHSISTETAGPGRMESLAGSWVLVWVLSSVIPLLLLVALTSVFAVLRWIRSRKDANKKNATADGYCWVSSGFQVQPDSEPH